MREFCVLHNLCFHQTISSLCSLFLNLNNSHENLNSEEFKHIKTNTATISYNGKIVLFEIFGLA